MNPSFRLLPAMLSFALASCASTSVHYHTMQPPLAQTAAPSSRASFAVDVLPVDVPAQLDQPQWVVRRGQGDMAVLDGERWASPFGDEVRTALSSELAAMLNTQDVAGLTAPADQPALRVKVLVRRFDIWPGQRVQLVADWELAFANHSRPAQVLRTGSFEAPATADYAGTTAACQRVIMDMAARIAADARAMAQQIRAGAAAP
jgi:uncharacterized lipoprotein YmbA